MTDKKQSHEFLEMLQKDHPEMVEPMLNLVLDIVDQILLTKKQKDTIQSNPYRKQDLYC